MVIPQHELLDTERKSPSRLAGRAFHTPEKNYAAFFNNGLISIFRGRAAVKIGAWISSTP
jgi:hypothetical protein